MTWWVKADCVSRPPIRTAACRAITAQDRAEVSRPEGEEKGEGKGEKEGREGGGECTYIQYPVSR